ncbi:MAG TPA: hypothetical protein VGY77_12935 [Gemmataceae bacterium]|nr:hypothetical protein [Gemmataceae bacterium]
MRTPIPRNTRTGINKNISKPNQRQLKVHDRKSTDGFAAYRQAGAQCRKAASAARKWWQQTTGGS